MTVELSTEFATFIAHNRLPHTCLSQNVAEHLMKKIKPKFEINIEGFQFIKRGPLTSGWVRSKDFLYRCAECGSTMQGDYNDYFNCACNAMYLDIDAGRFGSNLGDINILTYKK